MKKILSMILVFAMIFSVGYTNKSYANNQNMQAAWIATAWNIDWPAKGASAQTQKQEMIKILDTLKDTGINTVMFQVRPKGDALYNSNINPWSEYLTGTQGKNPGYDPLEYVIQEAHKRGIKVHAWLNPYRITTTGTDIEALSKDHPARLNQSWVLEHNSKLYYNPELPEVKQYISDTVAEIVSNYDVDGIVFDDYFYPTDYPLPPGEHKDGAVANARRDHISETMLKVKNTIKSIDSTVEFGVSPRGVWKNKNSDPMGSDTGYAKESYYADYADTVKWVKEGYIDYIIPQVYWEMDHNVAPYKVVTDWWVNISKGTNVDLYIGHTTDKVVVAKEIDKQLQYNKNYKTIKGSAYYNTKSLMQNNQGARDKIKKELSTEQIFTDINQHWAKNEIIDFSNKGYINGYADGTFRPENSMTRAEFVKTFNKVFGLTNKSFKTFEDTVGHWAQVEIDIAVTAGVANGISQTQFAPDEPITREQAAKMLANYKRISDNNHDKSKQYHDYIQISDWAKDEFEAVIEVGYMSGTPQGYLNPVDPIKRAEVVSMLYRVN